MVNIVKLLVETEAELKGGNIFKVYSYGGNIHASKLGLTCLCVN